MRIDITVILIIVSAFALVGIVNERAISHCIAKGYSEAWCHHTINR